MQGEKNAIAPGKTPLSSMTPTIVVKDGKPVMVVGTPGGSRIITVVMQTILDVDRLRHDDLRRRSTRRASTTNGCPTSPMPKLFALSPDTRKILEGMGHHFGPPQPVNQVDAILVGAPQLGAEPVGGDRFYGVNDPAARQRRGGRLLNVGRIHFSLGRARRARPVQAARGG